MKPQRLPKLVLVRECTFCDEVLLFKIPDYISYLYHKYLFMMSIEITCEECASRLE